MTPSKPTATILLRTAQVLAVTLFIASTYLYQVGFPSTTLRNTILLLTAFVVPVVVVWSTYLYLTTTPRTLLSRQLGVSGVLLLASAFAGVFVAIVMKETALSYLSSPLLTYAGASLLAGMICWNLAGKTQQHPTIHRREWYRVFFFIVAGGSALASLLFLVWQ